MVNFASKMADFDEAFRIIIFVRKSSFFIEYILIENILVTSPKLLLANVIFKSVDLLLIMRLKKVQVYFFE